MYCTAQKHSYLHGLSPEFYTCAMHIAGMIGESPEAVLQEAAKANCYITEHMHGALLVHKINAGLYNQAAEVRPRWQ